MKRGIEFDEGSFHPQKVTVVRHNWMDHPLLQLDKLTALAKRLAEKGAIRTHNAAADYSTSFVNAPQTHPTKLSPVETIQRIEEAQAWMALHNIQHDPEYRTLVDEILDEVAPRVEKADPGMHGRAGWIFVTSPNAVTPYHMDHENNFILQCLGKKRVYVWEPLDREVVTERSLELFHTKHSRELVVFRDDILQRAHSYDFVPGMGAYMPSTAPHLVKNGDGVSITISLTYYTRAIRETKLLYKGNYTLRELGLSPHPIGEPTLAGKLRDRAKLSAAVAQQTAKLALKRQRLQLTQPAYAPETPLG
jgi:hypothetical protein